MRVLKKLTHVQSKIILIYLKTELLMYSLHQHNTQ